MKNLFLVGGNRSNEDEPINSILKIAKKKNYKIHLYTENIHLKKKCKNFEFRKFLKINKIKYKKINNINEEILDIKKKIKSNKNNFMLLCNSIWKIDKNIISLFKNKIFNIHIGKFPYQIGAGGATWLRLVNAKLSSITIHAVNEEFDRGKILVEHDFKLKKNFSLMDYYKTTRKNEIMAYNKLFSILSSPKKNIFKDNNERSSIYMPRLNTKIHGYIDWSWNAKDIVNFINAFSTPYEGASTFIKKKKYFLQNAKFKKNKINFHPFQSGIIFRKNKKSLSVAGIMGEIEIKQLYNSNGKKVKLGSVKLGSRFYTPSNEIDKSNMLTSLHTSKGILIKN